MTFWMAGPRQFGQATGADLRIGRNIFRIPKNFGVSDISIEYIVVDTLRVARSTFSAIWKAWRDGYAGAVSPREGTDDGAIADLRRDRRRLDCARDQHPVSGRLARPDPVRALFGG